MANYYDISLTSGMSNSLFSLQDTSKLINRTQTRLATGKAVNSPLDNPTNFFAAKLEAQRASDLRGRMDAMNEGVQTVKAADVGITAMISLIKTAKAIVQDALATGAKGSTTNEYTSTHQTLITPAVVNFVGVGEAAHWVVITPAAYGPPMVTDTYTTATENTSDRSQLSTVNLF